MTWYNTEHDAHISVHIIFLDYIFYQLSSKPVEYEMRHDQLY